MVLYVQMSARQTEEVLLCQSISSGEVSELTLLVNNIAGHTFTITAEFAYQLNWQNLCAYQGYSSTTITATTCLIKLVFWSIYTADKCHLCEYWL
jgi:hypothetical protein